MASSKGISYLYSIFGIALVLIVLGVASVLAFEVRKISTGFKENFTVIVVLKDDVAKTKVNSLQSRIQKKRYSKSIQYVSKDDAAEFLKTNSDIEKDFLDILGYNPLYASFKLNLKENYVNKDSFELVKKDLSYFDEVAQINFQSSLLESIDKKAGNVSLVLVVIGGIFLSFAVSLIFSTIRIAMFSNRFVIKTQQLFGATKWFIIRPFLWRSIINGLISGVLACTFIGGLIYYFNYIIPDLGLLSDLFTFGALFGSLILFGIMISFFSTLTAVLRYLRVKVEDLY